MITELYTQLKEEDIFKGMGEDEIKRLEDEEKARKEAEQAEWSRRHEEERRLENERKRVIATKLQGVLRSLGFDKEEYFPEDSYRPMVSAKNQDGEDIFMEAQGNRVTVHGSFPKAADGSYVTAYDENHQRVNGPTISFSLNRTPEAMKREIERRFLPPYREALELVRKRVAETDSYSSLTKRNMEILKGSEVTQREISNGSIDTYNLFPGETYGDIRVSGNNIELKLRSLTIDQAKAALAALGIER